MRDTARIFALAIGLLHMPVSASAQQPDCLRAFDVLTAGDGTRAFDCLLQLSKELDAARAQNASLKERLDAIDALLGDQMGHAHEVDQDQLYPPKPHRHSAFASTEDVAAVAVPSGAIMAFDLTACPEGWVPFAEGQSRMIVGAKYPGLTVSGALGRNGNGEELVEYGYREHGGAERETLKTAQMPSHTHAGSKIDVDHLLANKEPVDFTALQGPSHGFARSTNLPLEISHEGGGASHNNMPPFIALYLCRKE